MNSVLVSVVGVLLLLLGLMYGYIGLREQSWPDSLAGVLFLLAALLGVPVLRDRLGRHMGISLEGQRLLQIWMVLFLLGMTSSYLGNRMAKQSLPAESAPGQTEQPAAQPTHSTP